MNPGLLNKRLKIYKNQRTVNESGFEIDSLILVNEFWSSVRSLSNREVFQNNENLITEDILIAKIRYRTNIDNSCIVEFKGQNYNIISIDCYDFKKDYMQLRLKRVVQGG